MVQVRIAIIAISRCNKKASLKSVRGFHILRNFSFVFNFSFPVHTCSLLNQFYFPVLPLTYIGISRMINLECLSFFISTQFLSNKGQSLNPSTRKVMKSPYKKRRTFFLVIKSSVSKTRRIINLYLLIVNDNSQWITSFWWF